MIVLNFDYLALILSASFQSAYLHMTNSDSLNDDIDDDFDREIDLDGLSENSRVAVRYRRSDIRAEVKVRSLLFSRRINVDLLDVSSKGAAIHSESKLKHKSRVCLQLIFGDGKRFDIDATVVHTEAAPRYGLKFDAYNGLLAEHLLLTQTDLHFG